MTDPGMKCTRCRGPARHRFPCHHVHFCDDCLDVFFQRQTAKALKEFAMLTPGQPVLVAISGGKDSLALWKVLLDLGHPAEGLHLELGLGDFGQASLEASQEMARRLDRPLHVFHLPTLAGHEIAEVVRANRRQFCSVCGTLKRYYLNRLTLALGFEVLATGHQLDDEAGRLLGNMLHRHQNYLDAQWPVLAASGAGFAKKIKPLCRLSGPEIMAYALTHELPVAQGKCPKSKGATLPYYQEAMRYLEEKMPGTMSDFYLCFLRAKDGPPAAPLPEQRCPSCGQPTLSDDLCTTCRLLATTAQKKAENPAAWLPEAERPPRPRRARPEPPA
ncbi:MAG: adenine nucleotide alpha hydrolase family protein [Deltaproteobacteria bacterium]|nr:adenine nucleotide alpha hydrolase family protein [Deltaproteobacteria bacterium]